MTVAINGIPQPVAPSPNPFGTDFVNVNNGGTQSTSSAVPVDAAQILFTPSSGPALWHLAWYGEVSTSAGAALVALDVTLNGATIASVTLTPTLGLTEGLFWTGFDELTLAAVAQDLRLRFWRSGGLPLDVVSIRNARLTIWRVS